MEINKKTYDKMTKKASPPSPKLKNCILAFLVGGFICSLGETLTFVYTEYFNLKPEIVKMLVPVTLITIAAILTGFGIFEKIAKYAGAGTLVPITGFSNAVVSPAIEFKSEGFVLGVGAKMFTIAGPVILYGTVASVVYGVIYWVTTIL
ncbi:MAG: stage V sporulation protein AC [Clostridia bacterium]|nr:stage V sporulation protein AC [Clostridia bacterium]